MKITRTLAEVCPYGFDCPRVYELEDGRLAVQGDKADSALLAELGLPAHETLVIVPRNLFSEV